MPSSINISQFAMISPMLTQRSTSDKSRQTLPGYLPEFIYNAINKRLKNLIVNKSVFLNDPDLTVEKKKNLDTIGKDLIVFLFIMV